MAKHNQLGIEGENLALEFLIEKQYIILEKNWRYKRAEVDIIARKDNWLIFVEVKTRSSSTFDTPNDSITKNKIKMLVDAAEAFLIQNDLENEVRFDVISIILKHPKPIIQHLENAFYPFASDMDN